MDKNYKTTNTTISYINYNMVFCTRCNRKIFKDNKVKELFKTECEIVCNYLDVNITKMNIDDYFVHMVVEANPKYSANEIIQKIKIHTSKIIRERIVSLNKLPSLWTREYLVTTDKELKESLLSTFLERQRK